MPIANRQELQPQMQTLYIPPYLNMDSNASLIKPGKVYATKITNNSSNAISLYPYLNKAGMENISWADSFLLAYLTSQISQIQVTDTDAIRLKLIQVMACKIEKTDMFLNNDVIFNPSDAFLYEAQNSLIGALSGVYQKQCGNYVCNTIAVLFKTGWFNFSNIQIAELDGHVCCQFLYKGQFAFVDLDPGEPGFMFSNPASANGFASVFDLHNDTSLITNSQRYYYVDDNNDSINLSAGVTIQSYQKLFDVVSVNDAPSSLATPLSISGAITLPAHASIVATYVNEFYYLDSSNLSRLLTAITNNNQNSMYDTAGQILGVSADSIMTMAQNNTLNITDYTPKTWQPVYSLIAPSISIILPATEDTVKMKKGTPSSINFPGYITSSTININFFDTIFAQGETPVLWTSPMTNASNISDGQCHYLSTGDSPLSNGGGIILPHSSLDTITVSYNPYILNFGQGFNLGYLPMDSITVESFVGDTMIYSNSTQSAAPNQSPRSHNFTSVPDTLLGQIRHLFFSKRTNSDSITNILPLNNNNISWNVYPNPVQNIFHVESIQEAKATIEVFDMIGNSIFQHSISDKITNIDASALTNGGYVYTITDSYGKVLKNGEIIVAR